MHRVISTADELFPCLAGFLEYGCVRYCAKDLFSVQDWVYTVQIRILGQSIRTVRGLMLLCIVHPIVLRDIQRQELHS